LVGLNRRKERGCWLKRKKKKKKKIENKKKEREIVVREKFEKEG